MHTEFWDRRPLEVLIAGPGSPQSFVLSQPFALIGSDPSCDIILPDTRLPQRCYLALLSSGGLVGTSLVRRSKAKFVPLNGDRGIRAGRYRICFRVLELDLPTSDVVDTTALQHANCAAKLRWSIDGRHKYARLAEGQALVFGRHHPSRLQITDSAVSAIHGVVYRRAEQLWLIDLGSRNGTKVHGGRTRCAALSSQDTFVVGDTEVTYELAPGVPSYESNEEASSRGEDRTGAIVAIESPDQGDSLEIEQLRAEIDRLRQVLTDQTMQMEELQQYLSDSNQYREQLDQQQADLDRQRANLDHERAAMDQLQQSWEQQHASLQQRQAEWIQREEQFRQELAEQQQQLAESRQSHETIVAQWRQSQEEDRLALEAQRANWESRRQAERTELDQFAAQTRRQLDDQLDEIRHLQQEVGQQKEELQSGLVELQQDREQREAQWQELAEQRLKDQELRDQMHVEMERAKELLLVRRIRLLRELQQREAELEQRRQGLEQREQALQQRSVQLTSQPPPRPIRSSPPKLPGSAVPVGPENKTPKDTARFASEASFELANPLLESADFTHILKNVVGTPLEAEDEASSAEQH